MRLEDIAGGGILSLLVPGYGHAMTGRRRAAIAWAALGFVTIPLAVVTVWMVHVNLALRVVAAIDGVRRLRRHTDPAWWGALPAGVLAVGGLGLGVAQLGFGAPRLPTSSMSPTLVIGDHVLVDKLTLRLRSLARGEVILFAYPCDPARDYVKRVIALAGDAVEVRCDVVHVNGRAVPTTIVDGKCTYDEADEGGGRWFPRACSRYHESLGGHGYDTFHDPDRPKMPGPGSRDFPRLGDPFPPSCRQADPDRGSGHLGKIVETKPASDATPCELQLHYVVPDGSVFVMGDNRNNSNDSRVWGAVSIDAVDGRVIGIWYSRGEHVELGRIGAVD